MQPSSDQERSLRSICLERELQIWRDTRDIRRDELARAEEHISRIERLLAEENER